jgi:hypothetical protein
MQHPRVEKRSTGWSRVCYEAEILLHPELSPITCRVRNISLGGATVVVDSDKLLTNRVELMIRKTKKSHAAVIAWVKADRVGLSYRG